MKSYFVLNCRVVVPYIWDLGIERLEVVWVNLASFPGLPLPLLLM